MIHLQLPDNTEYRVTENNGILILEGKERRAVKVKHESVYDISLKWIKANEKREAMGYATLLQ